MDVLHWNEDDGSERDQVAPSPEAVPIPPRDRGTPAKGGGLGVTVFVLFAMSLLAFGRAPLAGYAGSDGSQVNFDLFSLAGIVGALLGLVFLLGLLVRGVRPWSVARTLGVIGALGLLAHAAFALASPLSQAGGGRPPPGSAGHQVFDRTGTETWQIDGRPYRVQSTYYLRLPKGLQFTIEYPHDFGDGPLRMDDESALAVAFPLMEHAYVQGLYDRGTYVTLGSGRVRPTRIGVVLLERNAGKVRGYRVGLSLEEIRARMGDGAE